MEDSRKFWLVGFVLKAFIVIMKDIQQNLMSLSHREQCLKLAIGGSKFCQPNSGTGRNLSMGKLIVQKSISRSTSVQPAFWKMFTCWQCWWVYSDGVQASQLSEYNGSANVWMGEQSNFLSFNPLVEWKKINHVWPALQIRQNNNTQIKLIMKPTNNKIIHNTFKNSIKMYCNSSTHYSTKYMYNQHLQIWFVIGIEGIYSPQKNL